MAGWNSLQSVCASEPVINDHIFHPPYSGADAPERVKAFADMKAARIAKYRSLYGAKNGLLLSEVQSDMLAAFTEHDPQRMQGCLKEWLQLYPAVSIDSQRAMAQNALYIGRLMLEVEHDRKFDSIGMSIINCVLDVSENACWYKDDDLRSEFALVAADKRLAPHRRAQAIRAMGSDPPAQVMSTDKFVKIIEDKLKTCLIGCRKEVQPVDYSPYKISWMKGKESNAAQTVTTYIIPSNDSAILLGAITELIPLYDSLQDSDKQIFSARIMQCTPDLQLTNLHFAADTLFWTVFRGINPFWLHGNQNRTAVGINVPFYVQSYDLQKAEKVLKKELEIEEIFEENQATEINLRTIYGDLLDEMGRREDSIKQYELIRSVISKMNHSGVNTGQDSSYIDAIDKRLEKLIHP
ncbi:MAG: hypothetical protein P4L53_01680 [Candidatus Obscuribacterales bacterium]|nr:hypothetical protein [Candidatus Obscuribacterales bacterium]